MTLPRFLSTLMLSSRTGCRTGSFGHIGRWPAGAWADRKEIYQKVRGRKARPKPSDPWRFRFFGGDEEKEAVFTICSVRLRAIGAASVKDRQGAVSPAGTTARRYRQARLELYWVQRDGKSGDMTCHICYMACTAAI